VTNEKELEEFKKRKFPLYARTDKEGRDVFLPNRIIFLTNGHNKISKNIRFHFNSEF